MESRPVARAVKLPSLAASVRTGRRTFGLIIYFIYLFIKHPQRSQHILGIYRILSFRSPNMSSIGPSLSSNTSPSLPPISSPVPPRWTPPSPSLNPLFISRQSPPLHTSSVSTWTIADVGATAPPSPASIVTLQSERSVAAPRPSLPLPHSVISFLSV